MRKSYVQVDGVLYEKGTEPLSGYHLVQPDIEPYTSMITGERIEGRAQHREHLKRHGMREVGNEVKYVTQRPLPDAAPEKRKELLVSQVQSMNDRQFRTMLNRDITNAKWNTRRY